MVNEGKKSIHSKVDHIIHATHIMGQESRPIPASPKTLCLVVSELNPSPLFLFQNENLLASTFTITLPFLIPWSPPLPFFWSQNPNSFFPCYSFLLTPGSSLLPCLCKHTAFCSFKKNERNLGWSSLFSFLIHACTMWKTPNKECKRNKENTIWTNMLGP